MLALKEIKKTHEIVAKALEESKLKAKSIGKYNFTAIHKELKLGSMQLKMVQQMLQSTLLHYGR